MKRETQILESRLESNLVDKVKEIGGLCWKFTSPGLSGVPDRLIAYDGRIVFVEMKAPGKRLRPLQLFRQAELLDRGIESCVVDSVEGIDRLIERLKKGEPRAI